MGASRTDAPVETDRAPRPRVSASPRHLVDGRLRPLGQKAPGAPVETDRAPRPRVSASSC